MPVSNSRLTDRLLDRSREQTTNSENQDPDASHREHNQESRNQVKRERNLDQPACSISRYRTFFEWT
jgi:hypothetical protein